MIIKSIILVSFTTVIIGFLIYSVSKGMSSEGSGSMTTIMMGATNDLMSKEQRRAAEVIVKQKAGKKMEEQTSGESED